jgi:hypothetical protein
MVTHHLRNVKSKIAADLGSCDPEQKSKTIERYLVYFPSAWQD